MPPNSITDEGASPQRNLRQAFLSFNTTGRLSISLFHFISKKEKGLKYLGLLSAYYAFLLALAK